MSIEFKFDQNQTYQRDAIDSIVNLFAGQESLRQGISVPGFGDEEVLGGFAEMVFGNSLSLAEETVRLNLRRVQDRPVQLGDGRRVPAISEEYRTPVGSGEMPDRFVVEMETGTGKTYVYVRTIAELHQKHGFTKFVIVVPSIAIREGVLSSLRILRDHIRDIYDGLQYDYYVYDSNALTRVRQFATSSHLQIMVVSIAAMTGDANNRIIHRATDSMNGYSPIEFLRACRPIVIMDEPQSLDGAAQAIAMETLRPLFRVGYSATPPDDGHLVYRLTPVGAYHQRLVKRIGVLSITKDPDPNEAFVDLKKITPSATTVTATAVINKATAQGTKATQVTLHKDDDLHAISGSLDVYQGWTVEEIHADAGVVEFGNGQKVSIGSSSSATHDQQQRLMLRQAVESHFEKELQLIQQFRRNRLAARLKPLTLFFIERVDDYAPEESKLRRWFEEEYESVRRDGRFRAIPMPDLATVHDGYFAVSPKGVAKVARADSKDAADAFERIMQKKEALLGFEEPLRFIFSHSALAEGWDNPNVFTICNLQEGSSTMRKRQQVGRGMRLPVMTNGERCHVDEINLLTVVAKESFASFARHLQTEIEEDTGEKFTGRIIEVVKKRRIKLKQEALDSPEFQRMWNRISPKTTYDLHFSVDAVVVDAVRRINEMPKLQPVRFRISQNLVEMSTAGLEGRDARDRGSVVAAGEQRIPDVVRELCRRLPLSRATIVRILKQCDRREDVRVNPAIFIDQVTNAMNAALYTELAKGIVYRQLETERWSADLFREQFQEETVEFSVKVNKSITDRIIYDSQVELEFAEFLDGREDIPLFVKLPDWFKIATPLGNYNPDWAIVRQEPTGDQLYLVRETKGGDDIDKLRWESEGWKIRFGKAHFREIKVDYAFGSNSNLLINPTDRLNSEVPRYH